MNASLPLDTLKSRNLAAARALAAAGCAVFPCNAATGQPRVPWSEQSSTHAGKLKDFWFRHPYAVPAIDLGKAGLLVLELCRSDSEDSDGLHTLRQISKAYGWKCTSPIVRFPEGLHCYFRQPKGEPLASDASLRGYGIVVHGKGAYVIGPGAVRADGGEWVKAENADLLEALAQQSVPVIPDGFVALLHRARDLASGTTDRARRPFADLFDRPAVTPVPAPPLRQAAEPGGNEPRKIAYAVASAPPLRQTADYGGERPQKTAPAVAPSAPLRQAAEPGGDEPRKIAYAVASAPPLRQTADQGGERPQKTAPAMAPSAPLRQAADQGGKRRRKTAYAVAPAPPLRQTAHPGEERPQKITPAPTPPLRQAVERGGGRPHKIEEEPDPASWQTPDLSWLGSGRTVPPAFPLDALGGTWGAWCAAHAQARNAPVDYVAGTLLAVTAAVIGNGCWPCASSEWREPPVLWIALVGAPSAGKSRAQEPVLDLVRAIQRDADTPLLTAGTSRRDLSQGTWNHPAGLLLYREEICGWLGKFNRRSGDGGEREMWLASYDGRTYGLDRLEDPEPADERLIAGILGSIAPGRLAQVVVGATDGLAARFLWCWPEPAPGCTLARKPVDNAPQLDALRRIFALEMARSEDEGCAPGRLELSDAAAEVFEALARAMKERALASFGDMTDVLRQAPGHCLRLATTLSFLDWSLAPGAEEPRMLEREHVERAVRLIESYFLPMATRAFGEAFIPARDLHAMALAHWLREKRAASFNAREVRRRIPGRLREAPNMDRACATLVEAGLIRREPCARPTGRPRGDFDVNPALRSS